MKPLLIDLYAGLGGWAEGGLAEGYDVIGFDIERHVYGDARYPGQLVLQDVRTLHGSQFKDAALIVCSPPCQEYSYMAMPWRRAKQIAAALRGHGEFPAGYKGSSTVEQLNALFDACFRIQREACEAAERHVPLVVENVRGAEPWVGRARWAVGSMYFWGDVPALMPAYRHIKVQSFRFDGSGRSFQTSSVNEHGLSGRQGRNSLAWGNESRWFNDGPRGPNSLASSSSKSPARKAASAMIARIPFVLASHVAKVHRNGL